MKKLFFLVFFLPTLSNSQANLDSLFGVWNDVTQTDSNRLRAIQEISWYGYLFSQPDSSFYFAQLQIDFATENGHKKFIADALNTQGAAFFLKSDYSTSIDYYTKSLRINEEIGDKSGVASLLNNIGTVYSSQGDYDKAIEYHTKSLKIREEMGHKQGISNSLNNIGLIYTTQGEYDKAIEYHTKSLEISEEIENKVGVSASIINIGNIYSDQKSYKKALDYYTRGLKIQEELGDNNKMATTLNNIGGIYKKLDENDKAIEYYTKSLKIFEETGDKVGISRTLNSIGVFYNDLNETSKAMDCGTRSLTIAKEIGYPVNIRDASHLLWILNKKINRPKESLEMYELYIATRDSLNSDENQRATIQIEYKFAYEKKAVEDSVKAAEDEKVKDALLVAEKAENKKNQQQQYFLYVGLTLALLFGGVIFNRFKLANKQKGIIEEQKQIVDQAYYGLEEAHKEITDSINYAERIQRSFLATKTLLDENLTEHFVFFQPKGVVSGDFYWAGKLDNGDFALVNADSTGHGVPGAIMSILNISSIESAVKDKLIEPAAIFNDTRNTIIERLKKDGSINGGKDGMDASLISFNPEKTNMSYVAAQIPIWIIRAGKLTEIKPEKMPIGKHDNDHLPFIGGKYEIQKDDLIYTLTDGFQDQFGGPKGKKFMRKEMREYILSICHLPLAEQHQQLKIAFSKWKGNIEQVDDVCIIGVRV